MAAMVNGLSSNFLDIDFEYLMRLEDQSELEELQKKRLLAIDGLKDFKQMLQDTLNISSTNHVLEEKRKSLRNFAFHSKGDKTIETWTPTELAQIFGTFGLLSDPESKILLFETCNNEEFTRQATSQIFYAQALGRVGRCADAIKMLKRTQFSLSEQEHGESCNYLGDAYLRQYMACLDLPQNLRKLSQSGNLDENLSEKIQQFHRQFLSSTDKMFSNITPEEVEKKSEEAKANAISSYADHFRLTGSHEPLLRTLMLFSQDRNAVSTRLEEIEAEKQKLLKEHALLDTKIELQAKLAKLSILSQGGCESRDYWVHSGHLESLAFSEELDIEEYKPILARLTMHAKGTHQLTTTKRRLQNFAKSLSHENKQKLVYVIDSVVDFIEISIGRLEKSGKGSIDDILSIKSSQREICMKETIRISAITDADEKVNQTVFRRTFNMRGMIYAPRPYFIPGGLSVVGGRVPDMIFSQADRPVFAGLLKRWELDSIDVRDPLSFCDQLIGNIRNCFQTSKLQNLHSDDHEKFDKTSDALIELVGIPVDKRRGTDCSTNCSAALIFLGDCREHAIEMCSFFDFWQKSNIDRILRSAYIALGGFGYDHDAPLIQDSSMFENVVTTVDEILATQLRAGHVGIYSFVQMEDKYQHIGWKENKPKLFRSFGLENLKRQEKLTDYELQHSFVLVRFGSGPDDVFVISPEWSDDKQKMQLPNDDGVLRVENLEMMESLELFNLVEEHTMTFLISEKKGGKVELRCKDSFYNEKFNKENCSCDDENSPYQFGDQVLELSELGTSKSMFVGTWKVWDSEKQQKVDVPIRIKLLPFSKRTDSPNILFNPEKVRFMGLGLDYVDIVGELAREERDRAVSLLSRRDRFLSLLHQNCVSKTP